MRRVRTFTRLTTGRMSHRNEGSRTGLWLLIAALAAVALFVFTAASGAGSSPTIISDQSDYTPGATVTLTGTGWAVDETVHIVVNDTIGQTWQYVADVTSTDGTIVDSFTLPTYFVSDYDVKATGPVSGTATTTFTDQALPASVQLRNWATTGNAANSWITGTLSTNNSDYKEGEVVPFQLDLGNLGQPSTAGDHWYAPVCRDYANTATGPYGYTSLAPFNTSRSAATSGGTVSDTSGAFTGVGIDILQVYEPNASSGSLDGNTFDCGSTQRLVIVKFDVTGTGTKYLLWGGRLSKPGDTNPSVAFGNSSSNYPGGSLQMRLASPDKTAGINPGAIIQLAKLTVTKVVDAGSATPDEWSFTVTGPNGYNVTQQVPSGQSSLDFLALNTGTYTVTESSVSGYSFVSGSGTNCTFNGATATCTVTAAAGGATNASATFHNTQGTGSLKLSKVFDAKTSGFSGTFAIGYDCNDGTSHDGTANLAAGSDTTITGIPVGTECTVSESTLPTAPNGWSFGTPSISPTQPVTIDSSTTPVEVTVTNSISRDQGYLKISKVFDPKSSGFTGTFDIVYNCGSDQTVSLAAGDSATVGPFDTGTSCTVSEPTLPTPPAGYVFGTPSISPTQPVTIVKGDQTAAVEVTVTNTISRTANDSGTLKLAKTLTGGPDGYTGPFTIGYECKSGSTTVVSGSKSVNAGDFATVDVPFYTVGGAFLLPITCTVSETPPTPPADYSFGTPTFDPSNQVTFTAANPAAMLTVTTQNTLTHDQGYLKISKVFDPKSSGFTGTFTVHYSCGSDSGDVTLAAGATSAAIGPYDTGTQCTVTEPTLPKGPAGWTFGTPSISPTQPVTIVKSTAATAKLVTVTNTIMQSGLITDTTLCTLPSNQFKLVFTPDALLGQNVFKLNASNPGQFYYNGFYSGPGNVNVTVTLPYPWVTQGNVPIHVYSSVGFTTTNGTTCLTPSGELANNGTHVVLSDYKTGTTTVMIHIPSLSGGFAYFNLHLDYGLKGMTGWTKYGTTGNDAKGTISGQQSLGIVIPDGQSYSFSDTNGGTTTITSTNTFKKDPGIGGLVQTATLDPAPGATVKIYDSSNKLLGTVTTDADGWYMWQYKYTGKAATFVVKATYNGVTQTKSGTLKSNSFLVSSFVF